MNHEQERHVSNNSVQPWMPDLHVSTSAELAEYKRGVLFYCLAKLKAVWQRLKTATVCLAWIAISSSAILINKHIMVDLHFSYPVSVAWLGLATTTVASIVAVATVVPMDKRTYLTPRQYMTQALPAGFCMALTFQTGNLSYLYLTVALIQMLKAFCPVITMCLLFAFKLEQPTPQLVVAVSFISFGVCIACYGEMNLSVFGLASMLTSVLAESVRLVLAQYILVGQQLHPMEGLMYISSACTLVLTSQAAVSGEWWNMMVVGKLNVLAEHPLHFFVAAIAGFGVNLLAILVIKSTSSLTLKVLGTVKDAMLVIIGIMFLHEQVTGMQGFGYVISLTGFIAYNCIKTVPAKTSPLPLYSTDKRN